jgi:hypothetical protein
MWRGTTLKCNFKNGLIQLTVLVDPRARFSGWVGVKTCFKGTAEFRPNTVTVELVETQSRLTICMVNGMGKRV